MKQNQQSWTQDFNTGHNYISMQKWGLNPDAIGMLTREHSVDKLISLQFTSEYMSL